MTELHPYRPRPARVEWEEQTLTGRRQAVEAELQRLDRAGQLVSRAGAVVESGGIVSVKIRRRPDLEQAATPSRPRRHPGWTIGVLLASSVFVVSLAWAVLALATVLAAIGTLLIGLAVVVGAVVVVPKMLGGDSYSQTMNIWKR